LLHSIAAEILTNPVRVYIGVVVADFAFFHNIAAFVLPLDVILGGGVYATFGLLVSTDLTLTNALFSCPPVEPVPILPLPPQAVSRESASTSTSAIAKIFFI
jgi:hypothetical protein